jgi:hypothetical protein
MPKSHPTLYHEALARALEPFGGQFAKEMSRFLVPDVYDKLILSETFLAYCIESVKYFMQAMKSDYLNHLEQNFSNNLS